MTEKEERLESLSYSISDYLVRLRDLVNYGKISANDNAEFLNLVIKLITISDNYLKGNVGHDTATEFFVEIQAQINEMLRRLT